MPFLNCMMKMDADVDTAPPHNMACGKDTQSVAALMALDQTATLQDVGIDQPPVQLALDGMMDDTCPPPKPPPTDVLVEGPVGQVKRLRIPHKQPAVVPDSRRPLVEYTIPLDKACTQPPPYFQQGFGDGPGNPNPPGVTSNTV
jgi:hypothetical protein